MTITTLDKKQNSDPTKLHLDVISPLASIYSFDPSKSLESVIADSPLYQAPLYNYTSPFQIDNTDILKSATALSAVQGIDVSDQIKNISIPSYLTFENPALYSQQAIRPDQLAIYTGIEPTSIIDAKKSIMDSFLFTQPVEPTSLFCMSNPELLKASAITTSILPYDDPSTFRIMSDTTSLFSPSGLLKSPEEKRIEVLESKIDAQQREILELKQSLKTERKQKRSRDVENSKLKKLLKYDKALSFLNEVQNEIESKEESIKQESNSKAEYQMYG